MIDFLASLPFGFLSYQLETAQVETGLDAGRRGLVAAAGSCGSAGWSRSAVRPPGAAGRPAGAAGIVPAATQRPPGPQARGAAQPQHRAVRALPRPAARIERSPSPGRLARRAGACRRRSSQSRLDRSERRRLAARILADLDIRIEALPAEAFDGAERGARGTRRTRDPRRGPGGPADPAQSRAAGRPDGTRVRDLRRPLSPAPGRSRCSGGCR